MRYDTPIYFQQTIKGKYNPDTANYEADAIAEVKRYANITNTGVKTTQAVYGEVREGSLTIRLQVPYTDDFELVRVGDTIYKSDFTRRRKSFVLSEVQNGKN